MGVSWKSYTQSLSKKDGKFVYDQGPEGNNSSPQYFAFTVDGRAGTINMIGYTTVVQHYIDDGRKLPATSQAAPGSDPRFNFSGSYTVEGRGGAVFPPVRINQNVGGAIVVQPPPPPVAPAPKR